jgi:hypothetical protein
MHVSCQGTDGPAGDLNNATKPADACDPRSVVMEGMTIRYAKSLSVSRKAGNIYAIAVQNRVI